VGLVEIVGVEVEERVVGEVAIRDWPGHCKEEDWACRRTHFGEVGEELLAGAASGLDLSSFCGLRFSTTAASPYVAEEWNGAETFHFAWAVRPKPAAGVGEGMNLRAAGVVGSFVEA
jgi:hypothetical protein